jgi:hypothetical protein
LIDDVSPNRLYKKSCPIGLSTRKWMPGVEKMDERLLAAALVAPFFICMIGFAVAIAFAPAVPNEIAPATEHDHEEMDNA